MQSKIAADNLEALSARYISNNNNEYECEYSEVINDYFYSTETLLNSINNEPLEYLGFYINQDNNNKTENSPSNKSNYVL